MKDEDRLIVYGGIGNHGFDASVLRYVNAATGRHDQFSHVWHSIWADGEPGARLEEPNAIQGHHVIIFGCPIAPKFICDLEDMVIACKHQYDAKSVTIVLSFLCFRRQDRAEAHHEITRLRWFIYKLKLLGADRLIVCEPHSVDNTIKYCQEFGLELYINDPTRIFAEAVKPIVQALGGSEKVRIYSPDFGSVGRGLALAQALNLLMVATPKHRINMRIETGDVNSFLALVRKKFGPNALISCDLSDIRGRHAIMREDELDSGGTSIQTSKMLVEHGATGVSLIVTHPVCSRGWKTRLFPYGEPQPFRTLWFGNTRPRGYLETEYEGATGGHIINVDIAPAIAETLVEVLKNLD